MRALNLRTRLLAILFLTFLPIVGLIFLISWEHRLYAENEAKEDVLLLTRVLAKDQSQQIESSRQLLMTLSQLPIIQNNDREACQRLFAGLLEDYDGYTNIALVDAQGNVTCSALEEAMSLNFAEESWFQELTRTRTMTFGNFRVGRVSQEPVIPLNYPVLDDRGNLKGAVSLVLSLKWFSDFIGSPELPDNGYVTILDRDATILARHPISERFTIGQAYPNQPVLDAIAKQEEGILHATDAGGDNRLYSFLPLQPQNSGTYIVVSIGDDVAFADVANIRDRSLIVLLGVILIAALMAWTSSRMITDPVRNLVQASQNLEKGDLSSRVDIKSTIPEISQLAATFNAMANSIEQRVEQRTHELREINEKLQGEIQLRRRIEQQLTRNAIRLRESNAALENFAYIASHDLQEPLRKVQAFGTRLQDKYIHTLGEEGVDYLNRMMSATSRMQQLIRDLLSYSRVTSQAKPFAEVDLNLALQEVQTDLETKIEQTHATIVVEKLPKLEADPVQIHQLFQNLLSNAMKYQHPERTPQIKIYTIPTATSDTTESGTINSYQICVEDNGIGFEEKYAERIFNLFERLHGRSEYEGTGIGLAICRKIVERHNGTISATSEPGVGSKFFVTLPAHQDEGDKYGG